VKITNGPAQPETKTLPAHKKNPEIGDKKTVFSSELIMEQVDAALFGDDEEITAMDWGNAYVRKISRAEGGKVENVELELHLEGDVKKTSKKVHWLAQPTKDLVPVVLIDYDYLINKKKIEGDDDFTAVLNPVTEYRVNALADANVTDLKKFDIIQFERKGFYIYQGVKDASGRMQFGFIPE
jgi:glutamyl-tRNA synthetase